MKTLTKKIECYSRIKEALLEIGINREIINNLNGKTKIAEILDEPIKLVPLLRNIGIPFFPYIGKSLDYRFYKDEFVQAKLTPEGASRIEDIGKSLNNKYDLKRARKLGQLGMAKGIAALYFELNFSDLVNVCAYELKQKRAAA